MWKRLSIVAFVAVFALALAGGASAAQLIDRETIHDPVGWSSAYVAPPSSVMRTLSTFDAPWPSLKIVTFPVKGSTGGPKPVKAVSVPVPI